MTGNEMSRLSKAVRRAIEELDAEHTPDKWTKPGDRGGCILCWPKDSGWPCVSRMIADDLRAALGWRAVLLRSPVGSQAPPALSQRHQEHYRTCNCLADSAECCVPHCDCHNDKNTQL